MFPQKKKQSLTIATFQAQHAAIREHNVFSPCIESGEQSPMTVLSNTLGAISVDTPKRTLFELGGDTPGTGAIAHTVSECSSDAGCCMDSPSPVDSAFSIIDDFQDAAAQQQRKNSLTSLKYNLLSHRESIMEKEEGHDLVRLRALYDAATGKENSQSPVEHTGTMTIENSITSPGIVYMKSPLKSPMKSPRCRKTMPSAAATTLSTSSQLSVPSSQKSCQRPTSAPATMFESRKRAQTTVDESPVNLRTCRFTSSEDDDDGFIDILDTDSNEALNAEVSELSSKGLKGLMSAPLLHEPSPKKFFTSPPAGSSTALKDLDCNTLSTTPGGHKTRRGLFKVPSQPALKRSATMSSFLKRPDRPRDCPSPIMIKRPRSCSIAVSSPSIQGLIRPEPIKPFKPFSNSRPVLSRSLSANVLEKKSSCPLSPFKDPISPEFIGDNTKPYCLPLINGKHRNLKSITPETVCRLLDNEYADEVEEYHIIDCRYPYEYDGGHIRGAWNIYTQEGIQEFFLNQPMQPLDKRRIIIFHCEFSSKRGPTLLNHLRNKDRDIHSIAYPTLFYPELYLLDGGYKAFFENDKTYCEPETYKPMDHEAHLQDLRHFKAKSKSWAGERSRLKLHSRKILSSSQPAASSPQLPAPVQRSASSQN